MLIEKPQCNFQNCRYCFDGNCRSADKYENCTLTDLHCEIAKFTVDLDNSKSEVERFTINMNAYGLTAKRLAEENEVLKAELSRYTENVKQMCENAKQEVAREIFEEIEKWLAYDGDIRMITEEKFAEIEKKYTEVDT